MSQVIAVGNLKGGTGKTTIAVNIACALAERQRVALIDADVQAAAVSWTRGGTAPLTARPMPMPQTVGDATPYLQAWTKRLMALRRASDVVVLDLPPQLEGAVAIALALADLVVVPVTPGGAEITATRRALGAVARARKTRPSRPLDCVLVPNRVDRRTAAGKALGHRLGELGEAVGPTLRQRAIHMDAYGMGTWVGAAAPNSEAHGEVMALVKFLRGRLRG
jgi:chromosome partitioning protein